MDVKQNRKLPILITIALIILVVIISMVHAFIHRGDPSSDMAKLRDVYPSTEDSIALVVNGRLSEVKGVWKDHQIYLKLKLVLDEINNAFYWDDTEKLLLYTTAEDVFYASADSTYQDAPVFYEVESSGTEKEAGDRVYVSLGYVSQYTNIGLDVYTDPLRAFIRSAYGECSYGYASDKAAMRTKADHGSSIVTELKSSDRLWLITEQDGWYKVYAGGEVGHYGYVHKSDLKDIEKVVDNGPYQAPAYTRTALDGKVCMVWHQVFNESGVDSIDGLLDNTVGVNVISPTWLSIIDSDGTIDSHANAEYINKVKARGLQIWALIENINTTNKLDYKKLLGTTSVRNRMVNTIMETVRSYGLDGINVDLEGLPTDAGDGYIQFMRELSAACRREGVVLSVCNYVPSVWTRHYHRDRLGQIVDYMMVMAYDEHYKGSDAGSTASLPFVKNGIADTIAEGVPAEKIVCGIPFYSRVWSGEGTELKSETISMKAMKEFLEREDVIIDWDAEDSQKLAEVENGSSRIWIEDAESLAKKLQAVSEYGIAGVSGWKLGMETREAWDVISEYLNR